MKTVEIIFFKKHSDTNVHRCLHSSMEIYIKQPVTARIQFVDELLHNSTYSSAKRCFSDNS